MSARLSRDPFVVGSMTFVGNDKGYFWLVADLGRLARGTLDDCGFAPTLQEGLHAMQSVPLARGTLPKLQHFSLAAGFYSAIWLGVRYRLTASLSLEDGEYEAERVRALCQPVSPSVEEGRSRGTRGRRTPQARRSERGG